MGGRSKSKGVTPIRGSGSKSKGSGSKSAGGTPMSLRSGYNENRGCFTWNVSYVTSSKDHAGGLHAEGELRFLTPQANGGRARTGVVVPQVVDLNYGFSSEKVAPSNLYQTRWFVPQLVWLWFGDLVLLGFLTSFSPHITGDWV